LFLFIRAGPAEKNPPDQLRRVYDILQLPHIIFISPESKYENDDDEITFYSSFVIFVNTKIYFF